MSEEKAVDAKPPKNKNATGEHKTVWQVLSQRAFFDSVHW